MREIKFRAWDSFKKKMYSFEELDEKDMYNDINFYSLLKGEYSEVKAHQYTGLKDKNGVEIYEGDVLSKHGHPSRKIIFENGCFVGVSTNVVQALNWKPGKLKSLIELHFKVVGNIYENPELLEESK